MLTAAHPEPDQCLGLVSGVDAGGELDLDAQQQGVGTFGGLMGSLNVGSGSVSAS